MAFPSFCDQKEKGPNEMELRVVMLFQCFKYINILVFVPKSWIISCGFIPACTTIHELTKPSLMPAKGPPDIEMPKKEFLILFLKISKI